MVCIRSLAALAALSSVTRALTSVNVHGSQFVESSSKNRFQLLGVDYQPGGSAGFNSKEDPLSNPDSCLRDAILLQQMGANTIRVYNLEPSLNHDECVSIFNAAGIYLVVDVNSPLENGALNQVAPWTTYNEFYLKRIFSLVEAFKDYPNLIGFFGGNEVINEAAVEQTPAYVRAVQRDLRAYLKKHSKRQIPIGYSAADIRDTLEDQYKYLSCDNGDDSDAGFFGLNSYSWCGNATYESSGYNSLTKIFQDSTIPVFFSEYGCNAVTPRLWTEVPTLYGEKMTPVWSGGLAYEFTQEPNNYGLVQVDSKTGDAKLLPDYYNLKDAFGKVDFKKLQSQHSTNSDSKAPKCSKSLITSGKFSTEFTLPKLPPNGQNLIDKGVGGDVKAGKIVDVSKYSSSKYKITDHNGKEISGLKLKVDSDGNKPGDATSVPQISGKVTSMSATGTTTATTSASAATLTSSTAGSQTSTDQDSAVTSSEVPVQSSEASGARGAGIGAMSMLVTGIMVMFSL